MNKKKQDKKIFPYYCGSYQQQQQQNLKTEKIGP